MKILAPEVLKVGYATPMGFRKETSKDSKPLT